MVFVQRLRENPGSLIAFLASLMSALFVVSTPFVANVTSTINGVETSLGRVWSSTQITYVVLQLISALLTVTAATLAWRGQIRHAILFLVPGSIAGLFPAVLPGFFGLVALIILKTRPPFHDTDRTRHS